MLIRWRCLVEREAPLWRCRGSGTLAGLRRSHLVGCMCDQGDGILIFTAESLFYGRGKPEQRLHVPTRAHCRNCNFDNH